MISQTLLSSKITSRTTGAKGCKFEQFDLYWTIFFIYLGPSCLSQSILVCFDLSWFISVYFGSAGFTYFYLLWSILDKNWISRAISDYLGLSQAISSYLKLSQATMGYLGLKLAQALSGYNELSKLYVASVSYPWLYIWLSLAISIKYQGAITSRRYCFIAIWNFFLLLLSDPI